MLTPPKARLKRHRHFVTIGQAVRFMPYLRSKRRRCLKKDDVPSSASRYMHRLIDASRFLTFSYSLGFCDAFCTPKHAAYRARPAPLLTVYRRFCHGARDIGTYTWYSHRHAACLPAAAQSTRADAGLYSDADYTARSPSRLKLSSRYI